MDSTASSRNRPRSQSSPLNILVGQQSRGFPSLGSRASTLPSTAGSGQYSHRRLLSQIDYRPRSPSTLSLCARPTNPDASVGMVRSTSHQPRLDTGDLPPGGNTPSSAHSVSMSCTRSAQVGVETAPVNSKSPSTTPSPLLTSVPMGRSKSETMAQSPQVSQAGSIPQHEQTRSGTPLLTVPMVGTPAIMVGPWEPPHSESLSPSLNAMRRSTKRLLSFGSSGRLVNSSLRAWRQTNHPESHDVWSNGDKVLVIEEEQPRSSRLTDTVKVDFCGLPPTECHDYIPKESVICAVQIPRNTRAEKHRAIRDSLRRSLGVGMSTRQWAMSPHANLRPDERSLMLRLDTEAQVSPSPSSRGAIGTCEALFRSRAARRTPVVSSDPSTAYWLGAHRDPAALADRKGLFGRYNEAPTPPMPTEPQDMLDEVSEDPSLLYDASRFDQKVRERNSARADSVYPPSVAPSMSRRPSECPSLTMTDTTEPTTPLDAADVGEVYSLGATRETKEPGSVPRTLPSLESPTLVTASDDWSNCVKEFSGGAESYGLQFEEHLETNYPTTLEGL